jgi:hypothetical protein
MFVGFLLGRVGRGIPFRFRSWRIQQPEIYQRDYVSTSQET